MTDHYKEAERLAAEMHRLLQDATANTINEVLETVQATVGVAQVHATLALVDATSKPQFVVKAPQPMSKEDAQELRDRLRDEIPRADRDFKSSKYTTVTSTLPGDVKVERYG